MNAPTEPQRPVDTQLLREVGAAVLLLLGLAGMVTAAFLWHPLAGIALSSLISSAIGLLLATGRE